MAIGDFLTTEEVAEKLGVTPARVRHLVKAGRLKKSDRVGHMLIFDKAEVERFRAIPRKPGRPKSEK